MISPETNTLIIGSVIVLMAIGVAIYVRFFEKKKPKGKGNMDGII